MRNMKLNGSWGVKEKELRFVFIDRSARDDKKIIESGLKTLGLSHNRKAHKHIVINKLAMVDGGMNSMQEDTFQ